MTRFFCMSKIRFAKESSQNFPSNPILDCYSGSPRACWCCMSHRYWAQEEGYKGLDIWICPFTKSDHCWFHLHYFFSKLKLAKGSQGKQIPEMQHSINQPTSFAWSSKLQKMKDCCANSVSFGWWTSYWSALNASLFPAPVVLCLPPKTIFKANGSL